MAFTPKELSGVTAGAALLGFKTVKRGTCLNAVYRAFGSNRSDGKNSGYQWATDALAGARASDAIKGTNIYDAPEGSVLYWTNVVGWYERDGKKVHGDAGHIAIKGRGNSIITIDQPSNGVTGSVSIEAFYKKWDWLRFAGYAYGPGAFMGHTVVTANAVTDTINETVPASESSTPLQTREEEETMTILVTSPNGQTLIMPGIGNVAMAPDDVKNTQVIGGPALQTLKTTGGMHTRIVEASNRAQTSPGGIILLVEPENGKGGGYNLLQGGRLMGISEMRTVDDLGKAGLPTVRVSSKEYRNYQAAFAK
jgi:hypothetical protein